MKRHTLTFAPCMPATFAGIGISPRACQSAWLTH
jgi:hypothetical protein